MKKISPNPFYYLKREDEKRREIGRELNDQEKSIRKGGFVSCDISMITLKEKRSF